MLFSGAVAGLRNPRAHAFIQDDPERALFGGPEQQLVGPWPKYSKEFMEARLKAGKG